MHKFQMIRHRNPGGVEGKGVGGGMGGDRRVGEQVTPLLEYIV